MDKATTAVPALPPPGVCALGQLLLDMRPGEWLTIGGFKTLRMEDDLKWVPLDKVGAPLGFFDLLEALDFFQPQGA